MHWCPRRETTRCDRTTTLSFAPPGRGVSEQISVAAIPGRDARVPQPLRSFAIVHSSRAQPHRGQAQREHHGRTCQPCDRLAASRTCRSTVAALPATRLRSATALLPGARVEQPTNPRPGGDARAALPFQRLQYATEQQGAAEQRVRSPTFYKASHTARRCQRRRTARRLVRRRRRASPIGRRAPFLAAFFDQTPVAAAQANRLQREAMPATARSHPQRPPPRAGRDRPAPRRPVSETQSASRGDRSGSA